MTKGFGADVVRAALAAGLTDVGESYVQELEAKAGELAGRATARCRPGTSSAGCSATRCARRRRTWRLWHSIDRLSLGAEVALRSPGAKVYAQVNTTGEPQKGGCEPARVPGLVDGLRDAGVWTCWGS